MQGRLTATAQRTCLVCAEPLDWRVALTPRKAAPASSSELYALCQGFACRTAFDQASNIPDTHLRRHLQWRGEGLRAQGARAVLLQARAESQDCEAAAVFGAVESRAGIAPAPDLRLVVPSGNTPLRRLSQRRRRAHAAHLDAIIALAFESAEPPTRPAPIQAAPVQPAPGPEAESEDSRLPGRLCGLCAGGCCAGGKDVAYLGVGTILRVMAANPDLDPDRLRTTYLGHLAERTIARSCVYHTRDGCSLPRSLRSDTCNNYACGALQRLQIGLQADPPVRRVVVMRRRQNQWNQTNLELNNDIVGGAVLTEAATTRLRPPTPGGWMAENPPPGRSPIG